MRVLPQDWVSYFCTVTGESASIRLNLALRHERPPMELKQLLWVWLHFRDPRPDGLNRSEESATLFAMEDRLVEELHQRCDAVFVGSITTQGRREFYFYAPRSEGLTHGVHAVQREVSGYRMESGHASDPAWEQYHATLFPSEREMQTVQNAKLLQKMQGMGANLELPHLVDHMVYFPNADACAAFAASLEGYAVMGERFEPGHRLPFSLNIQRRQPIRPQEINAAVLELYDRARKVGGEYDGWGAPVETGQPA